jgi:hypothetical protein
VQPKCILLGAQFFQIGERRKEPQSDLTGQRPRGCRALDEFARVACKTFSLLMKVGRIQPESLTSASNVLDFVLQPTLAG